MSYLRGDMGGLMKGAMSTFKSMTTGGGAQEKARQTVSDGGSFLLRVNPWLTVIDLRRKPRLRT